MSGSAPCPIGPQSARNLCSARDHAQAIKPRARSSTTPIPFAHTPNTNQPLPPIKNPGRTPMAQQLTLNVDGKPRPIEVDDPDMPLALCPARRARLQQSALRLRARPVRRLHGPCRWPRGALLHHAGFGHRRQQDHHARRHRHAGEAASGPEGLDRGAGEPVRLLHQRLDHDRGRTARPQPAPDRRADQGGAQRP